MIKKKDLSQKDKKIWNQYIKDPSDIYDKDKDNTYTSILSGEKSREAFIRDIIIAGVKSDIFDPAKVAKLYPELADLLYDDA